MHYAGEHNAQKLSRMTEMQESIHAKIQNAKIQIALNRRAILPKSTDVFDAECGLAQCYVVDEVNNYAGEYNVPKLSRMTEMPGRHPCQDAKCQNADCVEQACHVAEKHGCFRCGVPVDTML